MRLLLLEDDAILGEGLRDYLRAEGHVVDWFAALADLRAVAGEPYDAWLVDWQLPDGSGLDWLARQRQRGDRTPAFMLTARDRLQDRVHGLDSGADDYLVKPVDPAELAARLRVLQRRSAAPGQGQPRVGDVEFDLAARTGAGRPVETLEKEVAGLMAQGFTAIKLGWGPFGKYGVQADRDQLKAAREGLGGDVRLCVDVGTVWDSDLQAAEA